MTTLPVLLVTGASRGLGRGVAVEAAAQGLSIAVNYAANRDAAAETIAMLIEIPAPDEQRQMLANAIVGMAESVGRKALRDPNAVVDGDQLAQWISELAWFGLRGVRTDISRD